MRIFLFTLWIWSLDFFAAAQILPEKEQPFNREKFMVYTEHIDSLRDTHYQIGTYNVKDTEAPQPHLPVYLRVARQDTVSSYYLDTKYDPDMFSFAGLPSDRLAIIKGRSAFYVYDIERKMLSRKLHPGLDQYEGEDAISGLYSGLILFDNEKFILGNVQGFGVFCYDISNPSNPIELMQYTIKKTGGEQSFYAFFYKTADNLFDMLIAQPDRSSESNIPQLFIQLKTVRYAAQDILLDLDISKFPISQPVVNGRYLPQDYFSQISAVKKHIYIGKTEEFCSSEQYEYANGIHYSFTDYEPCEQCGHGVTKTFIPNFNITQGLMFTLIFYGYRNPKELYLEQTTDNEIRLLWEYSEIKIMPHEGGILIIDDVVL